MSTLLDPNLCRQTVTLYQKRGEAIFRTVVHNACLEAQELLERIDHTAQKRIRFTLILPEELDLQPEDRVYEGVGPECGSWAQWIPAAVPGLMEIVYAEAFYWDGKFSHWEAGA